VSYRGTRTMETNRLVTIGALSKRTEVNIEAIPYYERIGILLKPPRSAGGHRLYAEEYQRRLVFVRRARELPLRTCARFFGSLKVGTWHVGRRSSSPKSTLLTSIGRSMN
jgi:MerR family regulatory protein